MKQKIFFSLLILLLIPTLLSAQTIQDVRVKGQIGNARIDHQAKRIFVMVNYEHDNRVYPLRRAEIERVITENDVPHTLPSIVDLRNWTRFTAGGEEWQIKGGYQLPHSDFGTWHEEVISGFITLGRVRCDGMVGPANPNLRIWDNGNPAYAASGSTNWPTQRIKLNDGTYAAELTTRNILGIVASGNLFTGRMERSMSLRQLMGFTSKDGKELIQWGVPFEARPTAIRVKFKYTGLTDSCTVMAVLENRAGNVRRFVGVAWYSATTDNDKSKEGVVSISEPDRNGLRTLETRFIYGRPHTNADPLPDGAVQGAGNEQITHVTVVFASSRRGDFFKGRKNAQLIVKDFEFVY
jgi:hypothetical protein